MVFGMGIAKWLPFSLVLLSCYPMVMGYRCINYARQHMDDPFQLKFLKLYALDLHSAFGIVLVLSLVASKTFFSQF